MPNHQAFLKVRGNQIQNQAGQVVTLHGIGLGGWMNMENFITGFPANENAFRQVVHRALGGEKADFFFDRYLEYFFTEKDAQFVSSLGLNLVRLPFNYRHFEDDMNPTVIRESGLKHLDRVIKICAENEIYTILDLHAAPGYQNQDWHSDNPSQQAFSGSTSISRIGLSGFGRTSLNAIRIIPGSPVMIRSMSLPILPGKQLARFTSVW